MPSALPQLLGRLGRPPVRAAADAARLPLLVYAAVKSLWTERSLLLGGAGEIVRRSTAEQVYWTALHPWKLFAALGLALGFATIVGVDGFLAGLGLGGRVADAVVGLLAVELLPLLLALVLIARSGTAISTELGSTAVRGQAEALSLAGLNTDLALVLPRLVGVTLAALWLSVLLTGTALFGGFGLAAAAGLTSPALSPGALLDALTPERLALAGFKAAAFGLVVAATSCQHGLRARGGHTAIPKANVAASTQALALCVGVHALSSLAVLR